MCVPDLWILHFFGKDGRKGAYASLSKKYFLAKPEAVVEKALKDSEKGKELSVYGYSVKALRVAGKILPHSLILKFL